MLKIKSTTNKFAAIWLGISSLGACTTLPQAQNIYTRENSDRLSAKVSYYSIPVNYKGKTWGLGTVYRVPYGHSEKLPAVVIVHGSGGVDSRGGHYVQELNRNGFATIELDLWAARNVRNPSERPKTVAETLPDVFAALDFLSKREEINANKIGITGFSWGGAVSMLTAVEKNRKEFALVQTHKFAAHAPFYPVCWIYNKAPGYEFTGLSGAPVLIQGGRADTYDATDTCEKLVAGLGPGDKTLVSVKMYNNATHAWERREPDGVANDPYSHEGRGGEFAIKYNPIATENSTKALIEFFNKNLK